MNRLHNWYCNRGAWRRHVREDLVPPAIDGLHLDDVLHHVPSPARRTACSPRSRACSARIGFLLLHIGDTKVIIPPASLPGRLSGLGFREVQVTPDDGALRFSARR